MVTRQEFRQMFEKSIDNAIKFAERWFGKSISHEYLIELYGAGVSGEILSLEEVLDKIYISPELFWFVIDIAVKDIDDERTTMFVRVSGHEPRSWDKTWQQPQGQGPFKVMGPQIKIKPRSS